MPNPFGHIGLSTGDVEKAKEFYRNLFSWEYEEAPVETGMPYTFIKTGAEPGGGIMKAPEGVPTGWTVYVTVDSVDAMIAKTTELGGAVIVPAQEIPGYGKFTVIQDPTGGVIAMWENFER